MYQQVRQDLLARIRRGEFQPGSLLPSENQLCQQYEVSITTARRAFLELVKEGVVERRAGVGTMVSSAVRQSRLSFLSIDYEGDAWRRTPSAMGEIIAGVGAASWQRDASFSMTGVANEDTVGYLRRLVEERSVDGVLLRTADDISEEYLEIMEDAGMPYVVIKRHVPGRPMNCVVSDDVAGARIATEHLLDLGHKRIGFVCAKPHITVAKERLAGYRAALETRNLLFDEALVRQESHFTVGKGREAVEILLRLPDPPTAIFVASDTMALGAYEAVRDLGLQIPQDVTLVGYDDLSPVAVLQPPLTTIRTSYYEFGRLAAQLLLNLIEGRETPPRKKVIEPALIVRRSAAEPSPEEIATPVYLERRKTDGCEDSRRLAGTILCFSGGSGPTGEEVYRRCVEAGAQVIFEDDAPTESSSIAGYVDTMVHELSTREDLYVGLGPAVSWGRDAARGMARHGGGHVVYTVSVPAGDAVEAELEAARAAFRSICRELHEEWGSRGVRANAVVYLDDVNPAPTVVFVLSDDAMGMSGAAITLGGTASSRWIDA